MRWIPIKEKLPPADIDVILYDADINNMTVRKVGEERPTATHWLPLKKVQKKGDTEPSSAVCVAAGQVHWVKS